MTFPRIEEYPWGYFEIQTEHFLWRAYKVAGGGYRPVTYRAEAKVKKKSTKYVLGYEDFSELDYKDKAEAFEAAKKWIRDHAASIAEEVAGVIVFKDSDED